MKRQHRDTVLLFAAFVVAELLLDAVAGDWLKSLVASYVGTIPAFIGLIAVLLLVWVRVEKYEALTSAGKKRVGGVAKSSRKVGKKSIVEKKSGKKVSGKKEVGKRSRR
ncbi:hypothetical protein [Archaeoglobus veneficus]|uniref:Uncharacterized protein n=2 Tax=root TaxID=1 RepID=F2KMP7_ARCVS|nr:hypothetical protein [Archaeoglobus veneficus]AEA46071.1 hypothetical protein Arcve_0027 [Archaeoglobus veneficus SNP6]